MTGYRQPPASSRFQKGRSGNPNGRPKGSRRHLPYDRILSQKVTIRDGDRSREVTAAEAFLLYLTKRGLEGDVSAARLAAEVFAFRAKYRPVSTQDELTIQLIAVDARNPSTVMEDLKMAIRYNRASANARLLLEPWLVQAALDRQPDWIFTAAGINEIRRNTRTPHKVKWPGEPEC